MNNKEKMLTTIDNPYSPFTQFTQWYNYDTTVAKHGTCAYLARMCDAVKEHEKKITDEQITEIAIKNIISNDYNNIYKIVTK